MVFSQRLFGLICLGATSLLWTSCQDAAGLHYSESQLVEVLADLHVARSAIQNAPPPDKDSLYEDLHRQVAAIHHMDVQRLNDDLEYLMDHPERLEKIYDKVIQSLEKQADPEVAN